MTVQHPVAGAALGIFLALLGIYVATSPGRVDILDGQYRYEVARNWLDQGRPVVQDPYLIPLGLAVRTPGAVYSAYNAAPSVAAMPLMLFSRALPGHRAERDRFFFTMTGPIFGAALGGLLVVAYAMLGVSLPRSVAWALAICLATAWWPGSTTVFDQNQHAVWLFAAVLLAWESARRARVWPAALGGLAGAVLLNYQENYALLLPLAGLAVASTGPSSPSGETRVGSAIDRGSLTRYAAFGVASATGLAAFAGFNFLRFGEPLVPGRYADPILFALGHPVAALVGLSVSPGKSLFLYSPPLVLAALGARRLFARAPALSMAIAAVTVVHVLLIAQLAFFGGDWCWGPRYLLVLIPLWALAVPFAVSPARRWLAGVLVGAGLLVQLLAVSVDHQRFFFERDLAPHFWALDPWFYLGHSQLAARVSELAEAVRAGVPAGARVFTSSPTGEVTYAPFGPPPPAPSAEWVRHFAVFYLPRPWPLWIGRLPEPLRPVEPWPWLALSGALMAAGATVTRRAVRSDRGAVGRAVE